MKFLPLVLSFAVLAVGCAPSRTRAFLPTVQTLPHELRMGAGPEHVVRKMGHPSYTRTRPDGRTVWTYNDLWWSDRSWGSWELFFTSDERLSGWKLIDPPSNQEFNRSAFFDI